MLNLVRVGAAIAGMTLAGVGVAAPAFASGEDPAGNNGTVKIINHGDIDQVPENQPHVGCEFQVEWYGFDESYEGKDIVSTLEFKLHSPTEDGDLSVDGPTSVPIEKDPAGGADKDLDARETYTLTASNLPHPEQGFHVKVTITTPGSKGNDTKSKVFWFQGCAVPPSESPSPSTSPSVPTESESPSESPSEEPSESPSESTPTSDVTEPSDDSSSSAPVPTNIDAGLAGESDSPVPAMWPLLAMLAGAGAAGTALVVVLRRRAAALVDKD